VWVVKHLVARSDKLWRRATHWCFRWQFIWLDTSLDAASTASDVPSLTSPSVPANLEEEPISDVFDDNSGDSTAPDVPSLTSTSAPASFEEEPTSDVFDSTPPDQHQPTSTSNVFDGDSDDSAPAGVPSITSSSILDNLKEMPNSDADDDSDDSTPSLAHKPSKSSSSQSSVMEKEVPTVRELLNQIPFDTNDNNEEVLDRAETIDDGGINRYDEVRPIRRTTRTRRPKKVFTYDKLGKPS